MTYSTEAKKVQNARLPKRRGRILAKGYDDTLSYCGEVVLGFQKKNSGELPPIIPTGVVPVTVYLGALPDHARFADVFPM